MKKISDYLDAARTAQNLPSDYALANYLGLTKQAVSRYRNNKGAFDLDVAWRVADAIGCDPAEVVAACEFQRANCAHDVARAKLWQSRLQQFAGALVLVFCGFFGSQPAAASAPGAASEARTMYIMLNILRVYLWHFASIVLPPFSGYFAPKNGLFYPLFGYRKSH